MTQRTQPRDRYLAELVDDIVEGALRHIRPDLREARLGFEDEDLAREMADETAAARDPAQG